MIWLLLFLCSGEDQQAVMASDLQRELGNKLFVPAPDQLARDGQWLSPEQLKHKVRQNASDQKQG